MVGEKVTQRPFFLLAGVWKLPSVISMDAIIISDNRKLQDKNSEK